MGKVRKLEPETSKSIGGPKMQTRATSLPAGENFRQHTGPPPMGLLRTVVAVEARDIGCAELLVANDASRSQDFRLVMLFGNCGTSSSANSTSYQADEQALLLTIHVACDWLVSGRTATRRVLADQRVNGIQGPAAKMAPEGSVGEVSPRDSRCSALGCRSGYITAHPTTTSQALSGPSRGFAIVDDG